MYIRSTKKQSPMQQIAENPSADVIVGSDQQPPQGLIAEVTLEIEPGKNLYKLSPQAISDREKLVGKSIKLADLSLSAIEQGLMLSQLNSPPGTDVVFETTGFILAGADMYHSLTKTDPDPIEIAIASTKAIVEVGDLIAPFVPILEDYKPHFQFFTVLLKLAGTGKEVLELTYKTEDINPVS